MITYLLILHSLCAVALLGALTHQAASVWAPARKPGSLFLTRFRAVKASNFVNAVIALFVTTFVIGSIVYPAYRIGARIYMEDLRMSKPVGSFEVKEHLVTFGLAFLPAYWFYWRMPHLPEHEAARKWLVLILAAIVWTAFLIGHALNNIKGL